MKTYHRHTIQNKSFKFLLTLFVSIIFVFQLRGDGKANCWSLSKPAVVLTDKQLISIVNKYCEYAMYGQNCVKDLSTFSVFIDFFKDNTIFISGDTNTSITYDELFHYATKYNKPIRKLIGDYNDVGNGRFYRKLGYDVCITDLYDFHIVHHDLPQIYLKYKDNEPISIEVYADDIFYNYVNENVIRSIFGNNIKIVMHK